MSYIIVNGFDVPLRNTEDTENPNYADAMRDSNIALLQNKSTLVNDQDLIIPSTGVLYFTRSGVNISDGDFRLEIESSTEDFTLSIRRSGVWVVYDRSEEDVTRIIRNIDAKFDHTFIATAESDDGNTWNVDTNGETRIAALLVNMSVNNLDPGESSAGMPIVIDDTGSAGTADSTTIIQGIPLVTTNNSAATKIAINARPNWDEVLRVNGNPAEDPTAVYIWDGATVTSVLTEFTNAGNDIEFFTNDNDSILVGFDTAFSIIDSTLAIVANMGVIPVFQYTTGNDVFSSLTIGSDGTQEFTIAGGQIAFLPPVNWVTSNLWKATGILTKFYVEITRTRNGLATSPTESIFKIFTSAGTDMKILGNGCIQPTVLDDAFANNQCIYESVNNGKLSYKDSGGTVNPLY